MYIAAMILGVCAAELCPLSEGLCYIYIYIYYHQLWVSLDLGSARKFTLMFNASLKRPRLRLSELICTRHFRHYQRSDVKTLPSVGSGLNSVTFSCHVRIC